MFQNLSEAALKKNSWNLLGEMLFSEYFSLSCKILVALASKYLLALAFCYAAWCEAGYAELYMNCPKCKGGEAAEAGVRMTEWPWSGACQRQVQERARAVTFYHL